MATKKAESKPAPKPAAKPRVRKVVLEPEPISVPAPDRSSWTCACGGKNPMHVTNCEHCGRVA